MDIQDCIFCKIVKGDIPAAKVHEDKDILTFLDIMPANTGHCLIVPKNHCENLMDMPEKDLMALAKTAQKVAKAISLSMGCEGVNLVMNNGKVAGQVVFHAHIHVIPRFKDDGHDLKLKHGKYQGMEMEETAKKIAKFL